MARADGGTESIFDAAGAPPFMLIRESALANNLAEMREFCERNGVTLAPHCKTHMSPELWRRQEAAGAVTATVATVTQAEALHGAGVRSILIANEVTDDPSLRAIARLRLADPSFEISFLVDSVAGVEAATAVFAEHTGLPMLPVFVELGAPGRRAGCRTVDEVMAIARAVAGSGVLTLAGVEGYEGVFSSGSIEERTRGVGEYLETGVAALRALIAADLVSTPTIASFGGSRYYADVIEHLRSAFPGDDVRVVLRSGCYLTHDHGSYAQSHAQLPSTIGKPDLEPAIEVWATVLSTPEPGRIIVGLGKRDASSDEGFPVALWRRRDGVQVAVEGAAVVKLNDQHAFLDLGESATDLRVGDLIGFGISHPCTTFDKWRTAHIVDDDYRVLEQVTTLFH